MEDVWVPLMYSSIALSVSIARNCPELPHFYKKGLQASDALSMLVGLGDCHRDDLHVNLVDYYHYKFEQKKKMKMLRKDKKKRRKY